MKTVMTVMITGLATLILTINPAQAGKRDKAELVVTEATEVVRSFAGDVAHTGLLENAANAKGIVIVPSSVRAGFVFGASGGNAVMLLRRDDGSWSEPTFLRIGSVSFGLQAGGEVSEIMLLVMTKRGTQQLLSTSVKLGADLSIAAGPTGVGGKVQTTDILAYSKSKGLYGSISLEGALLKTHHKWNKAYYGREVSPLDITILGKASNPHSTGLRRAVSSLSARGGS